MQTTYNTTILILAINSSLMLTLPILLVMNHYKVILNFETHISHIETTLLNMNCYQDLDKEFSAVLLEQFV